MIKVTTHPPNKINNNHSFTCCLVSASQIDTPGNTHQTRVIAEVRVKEGRRGGEEKGGGKECDRTSTNGPSTTIVLPGTGTRE